MSFHKQLLFFPKQATSFSNQLDVKSNAAHSQSHYRVSNLMCYGSLCFSCSCTWTLTPRIHIFPNLSELPKYRIYFWNAIFPVACHACNHRINNSIVLIPHLAVPVIISFPSGWLKSLSWMPEVHKCSLCLCAPVCCTLTVKAEREKNKT